MKPRIYLSPPHMSAVEREALLEAFDSNWIAPLGPMVDEFEAKISEQLGGAAVCVTSSGTAALHLALLLLGVGPGDDVLVPTLTFAATANAVQYVGARPIFVDCEEATWAIDPDRVAAYLETSSAAGRLPKALISVDLYGQPADYERLRAVLAPYGLPLVQDAAEALGSLYRGSPVGSQGDYSILSFNGNKIITTSGGGALASRDSAQIARARKLASQAREPALHYEHREIGYNYRLSNLLAAVGVGQLASLSQKVDARRAHNAGYKRALGHLPGVRFFEEPSWARSNYWLTVATIEPVVAGFTRDELIARLARDSIEARPTWKPMHTQPVFAGRLSLGGDIAESVFREGICLPSGSSMTDTEREEVSDLVLELARR